MRATNLLFIASVMLAAPVPAQVPSAPPSGEPVSSLIGPALFVSDIARSVRFYEALGFRVGMQMGSPERHETILSFGGDPRSPGMILLSDMTAKAPVVIEHGHGYDRTILRIGNLTATAARLQQAGFATTPIRDVAMGYRMMVASDPDGYKLEMVETRPRP
jgi:catechol 2,3-dioxygenase-like lactoylglutathione lyase family enzyme